MNIFFLLYAEITIPYIVVAFIPILSCVHSCSVNPHTFTSVVTPPTHTFSYTNSPLLQAPYRASVHIYCTAWTSTRVCSRNPQDWDTANVSVTLKNSQCIFSWGGFEVYTHTVEPLIVNSLLRELPLAHCNI